MTIQSKYICTALLVFIMLGAISCKPKIENLQPKAQLNIVSIVDSTGQSFQIKEVLRTDTVWVYPRIKADTLIDPVTGKHMRDEFNKFVIKYDTTYRPGEKKGTFILLDTILLPSLKGKFTNIIKIKIESNARWQSPLNSDGKSWFVPMLSNGGGDGEATFKVGKSMQNRRSKYKIFDRQVIMQTFFTRDSAILYQIPIDQKGRKEKQ